MINEIMQARRRQIVDCGVIPSRAMITKNQLDELCLDIVGLDFSARQKRVNSTMFPHLLPPPNPIAKICEGDSFMGMEIIIVKGEEKTPRVE
jgi:hypothetical protein